MMICMALRMNKMMRILNGYFLTVFRKKPLAFYCAFSRTEKMWSAKVSRVVMET